MTTVPLGTFIHVGVTNISWSFTSDLHMLEATKNELNGLPEELGYLRHLEQLYLRHNKLTHIPVLFGCKALKVINTYIIYITTD